MAILAVAPPLDLSPELPPWFAAHRDHNNFKHAGFKLLWFVSSYYHLRYLHYDLGNGQEKFVFGEISRYVHDIQHFLRTNHLQ